MILSRCSAIVGILLLCVGGVSAQDASLVREAAYSRSSPTGRFRIDQYHTTGNDAWDWQFWIFRKGVDRPVKLPTGERDPAFYGATFSFHPSEKWLIRTQKTGSGDNVAVLYRITSDGQFKPLDLANTFDEMAWAQFDRAQGFSGERTQRYHTGCEFLGWEPDGETLRLKLTASHCFEEYHANWTVHYHLRSRKFFFATDDVAHNTKQGVVWKQRRQNSASPEASTARK
jgi:hypothetical protein